MIARTKAAPEPTLAERMDVIHAEINAFIDGKAKELKDGPCQGLPYQVIRALVTRNDGCLCRAFNNATEYGK